MSHSPLPFRVADDSHFIVNNILEGLIWFFVPASLVICNDVMAYICGKAFGKTPLIKLSPKKTVEGFVGAFICTLIFAYGVSRLALDAGCRTDLGVGHVLHAIQLHDLPRP